MNDQVIITTLVENAVNTAGLRGEHGAAFLIEAGGRKLLFDTGQSDLLLHNAAKLGLALEDLDAFILSHGHYDHTSGIEAICRVAPRVKAFAHPAALAPKFSATPDGIGRYIGMPTAAVALLRTTEREVQWTRRPTEVAPGVHVTGEIPRTTAYEDTGGRFFLDADCTRVDLILDDQALFFDTQNGLVVVLGCAHSGIVNTLNYILDIRRGRPLWAVLGGMHLLNASPSRMDKTIEALARLDPKRIIPSHCTGMSAVARLWAAFPERCSSCPVGTRLVFQK